MLNSNKMLKRATPELRKVADGNQDMFDDLLTFSSLAFDDMVMFYNTGKRHREAGRVKYTYIEFVARHPELQNTGDLSVIPYDLNRRFVTMLYRPYCDGFDGVKR